MRLRYTAPKGTTKGHPRLVAPGLPAPAYCLLGGLLTATAFLLRSWLAPSSTPWNSLDAAVEPGEAGDYSWLTSAGYSNLHILVSTSCSAYQKWQTQVLIRSHERHTLPGRLTEVLACNDSSWAVPPSEYAPFRVVQVPDFDTEQYSPRNKPHSLNHLLQILPDWIADDELVVVVDPDHVFLRPWPDMHVTQGHPAAAIYSQGDNWLEDAWQVCGGSPACNRSSIQHQESLQIGTPYVLHAADFKTIVPIYAEAMDAILADAAVRTKYDWIAEMHAYTIATLRTGLPHRRLPLMISDVGNDEEPWHLVHPHHVQAPLAILHYCQDIVLGDFKWFKHYYHDVDMLDCAMPREKYMFPPLPQELVDPLQAKLDERWSLEIEVHNRDNPEEVRQLRYLWYYQQLVPTVSESIDLYHHRFCPSTP